MSLQVLLITGDDANAGAIAATLRRPQPAGTTFLIDRATTLAGALRKLDQATPDLVLVNLALADSAGTATYDSLVAALPDTPIVILSGGEQDPVAFDAVRRGAAAFFSVATSASSLVPQTLLHIIHHAQARHKLTRHQAHAAAMLESMADAVIGTRCDGRVEFLNRAAALLLDCAPGAARGQPIAALMPLHRASDGLPVEHPVLRCLATHQAMRLAPGTVLVRRDGSEIMIEDSSAPIFDRAGQLTGVVMVFHDITEAYETRAQLDFLAWNDFLTELPNRFALHQRLNQTLAEAGTGDHLALLYLDLDNFKWVNDSLGHAAGDQLLVEVAQRLRHCVRSGDMVSRQGGDEFVLLLAPQAGADDAVRAAERVMAAFAPAFVIDATSIHTGCSIGMALYPEHGRSAEVLLRHADAALHSAKAAGRRTWRLFTEELHTRALRRRQLEDGLRQALDSYQLALHYQPKIDLRTHAVCGAEALLRWTHPEWGRVPAGDLVRCAEESGMIVQLGRWVIAQACAQLRAWRQAGRRMVPLAINLSAWELRQPDFFDFLQFHLELCGVAPDGLQLEITESALVRDIGPVKRTLAQLRDYGIGFAIDDFGTGYSSLSYLADLPVDVLKLDRSFVHGIDHAAPNRQALVHAVLALARHLGLEVVAEGIETAAEEEFLVRTSCGQAQGFLYSPALDPEAFARFAEQPLPVH